MSKAWMAQLAAVAPQRASPRDTLEITMPSDEPVARRLSGQHGTLGKCWIVYGIIRLIAAAGLVIYASTPTLMFGALLNRVPDPFTLMGAFHFLYAVMIALSVACGVLGIMAGLALLSGQRSDRTFAMIAGLLSLSDIPLGTALGGYTLIVLLPTRVL